MLKQLGEQRRRMVQPQPPSGGCVLKPNRGFSVGGYTGQPPSGGCVLKQDGNPEYCQARIQPPSGGCVLKLAVQKRGKDGNFPAAFRRLCVETTNPTNGGSSEAPAAFRRLCVETANRLISVASCEAQPPSGGCVLKL